VTRKLQPEKPNKRVTEIDRAVTTPEPNAANSATQNSNRSTNANESDQQASANNHPTTISLGGAFEREGFLTDDGEPSAEFNQRYIDRGLLGRGGTAEVRRVLDTRLNRELALKVLRSDLSKSGRRAEKLIEEAQITSQLNHPGIIPVHDIGYLENGQFFFTMPIVQGKNLDLVCDELHTTIRDGEWGETTDGWTFRRIIDAFKRVCVTVAYAHSQNVIHRDLKPQNIMLGEHGEVFVLDWGIAKLISDYENATQSAQKNQNQLPIRLRPGTEASETIAGSIFGTPSYMSPEQARGQQKQVGTASDIYALGAILYKILSGVPPFQESEPIQTLAKAAEGESSSLSEATLAVMPPWPLVKVQQKAMNKVRKERFANATLLAESIQSWIDGTQRNEEAAVMLEQYKHLSTEIGFLEQQQIELQKEAEKLLRTIPAWAPAGKKSYAWQRENLAHELTLTIDSKRFDAEQKLHAAYMHAPSASFVQRALVRHYHKEHIQAETEEDKRRASRAELRLRAHASQLHSSSRERIMVEEYLESKGTLSITTEPEGFDVLLCEYRQSNRRMASQFIRHLGRTPVKSAEIPQGSHHIIIRKEHYKEAIVPVSLTRNDEWKAIIPGTSEPYVIRMFKVTDLNDDDCYVPAGWFRCGGDPTIPTSLSSRRLWLEGFIIKRYPVTNAEYLTFLNDLLETGRTKEAFEHAPRQRSAKKGEQGELLYNYDENTGFAFPDHKNLSHETQGELPATSINWFSCVAYCRWFSEKTGFDWRLPHELEWEKAARGIDGRFFPWGNTLDPSWCCMRQSHKETPAPASVFQFPLDEGPYGVRGQSGNVRDWCINTYEEEIPWKNGDVVRWNLDDELSDYATSKVVRGGSWITFEGNCRAAFRFITSPDFLGPDGGFRLARSI